jgi:DNA recombination-dependent growth factor C
MKKGSSIIGVRSASLHGRVAAYVAEVNDENITMSSVVRDAIKEKIERLEAEAATGKKQPASESHKLNSLRNQDVPPNRGKRK